MPERASSRRRPTAASSSCRTCATARTRTSSAAFYRDLYPAPGSLVTAQQLQGKELSYNNIADADAAWECVKSFDAPACVIVKHANPCGVALGADAAEAYAKAFKTDPTSAFGGIIAFNREVDGAGAAARRQAVRRSADRAGVHARGAAPSSPPRRTCACCRSTLPGGAGWHRAATRTTSSASARAC